MAELTLAEQCAFLVAALENKLLQPAEIVRWADEIIVVMDQPREWVIGVATLNSPYGDDYADRLRVQVKAPLLLRTAFNS